VCRAHAHVTNQKHFINNAAKYSKPAKYIAKRSPIAHLLLIPVGKRNLPAERNSSIRHDLR